MTTHWIDSLTRLTDEALLARVHDLAHRERRATVALVAHLAELDERRLYLDAGCSSLFTYCTEVLHFSEHAAYNRIECARAARRFPVVLDRLADGSVHLTAVRLLSPHFTPANHVELLERAKHLGKREVEEIVVALRPQPDVVTMVRRLPDRGRPADLTTGPGATARDSTNAPDGPAPGAIAPDAAAPGLAFEPHTITSSGDELLDRTNNRAPEGEPPISPRGDSVIAPLAPGRFRVQFTADQEMHQDLMMARELLRHQVPNGDAAAVMKMALKLLVKELRRRKFAETDRAHRTASSGQTDAAPRRSNAPANSRHIPAAVRREVARRDDNRCAFRGRGGRRCSARGALEFHHLEPFAVGGMATVDNISLRCRAHNSHEAVNCFGRFQLVPERVDRAMACGSLRGPDG